MKRIILLAAFLTLTLPINSCSLFKNRSVQKSVERSREKAEVALNRDEKTINFDSVKGTLENRSKAFNEEITIKNAVPAPVELTATFRVDTSASLNGDTALKLVDINNADVSVAIYQNKKTNELMAKVSTGKSTKNMPFSEMQIKRNYTETDSKKDSSKVSSQETSKKVDSVGKKDVKDVSKAKDSKSEVSSKGIVGVIGVVAVIVVGVVVYFLIKSKK